MGFKKYFEKLISKKQLNQIEEENNTIQTETLNIKYRQLSLIELEKELQSVSLNEDIRDIIKNIMAEKIRWKG